MKSRLSDLGANGAMQPIRRKQVEDTFRANKVVSENEKNPPTSLAGRNNFISQMKRAHLD
jgi:hypothetical protein